MKYVLPLIFIFFTFDSLASLQIPRAMNSHDRHQALKILGFSGVQKIYTDPSPLGGYPGYELGFSYDVIQLKTFEELGTRIDTQKDLSYVSLGFSKGLFYDVDLGMSFTPLPQGAGVAAFSGQIHRQIYKDFYGVNFSLWLHGNSTSFVNVIHTKNLGVLLTADAPFSFGTLYAGAGYLRCIGSFIGGADGVTDTAETIQEDIYSAHWLLGGTYNLPKNFFIAVEANAVYQVSYGFKFGQRF